MLQLLQIHIFISSPYSSILYANRAMCYLKLMNFTQAFQGGLIICHILQPRLFQGNNRSTDRDEQKKVHKHVEPILCVCSCIHSKRRRVMKLRYGMAKLFCNISMADID